MMTIGMLGGMSWESSAHYYRLANELVRDRLGGHHSARCVLYSVDFADVERRQAVSEWDEAADLLLLCTNTMHKVADQVAAAIDIPLLHIADVTADAVRSHGLHTVGLLGTAFTMEQDFLRERLAGHGLTVLVPDAADRKMVHSVIYDELCLGVVSESSRARYLKVIERLIAAGAQGVVLGCTEIELLVRQEDTPLLLFPTSRLHVAAAVDQAIAAEATVTA